MPYYQPQTSVTAGILGEIKSLKDLGKYINIVRYLDIIK